MQKSETIFEERILQYLWRLFRYEVTRLRKLQANGQDDYPKSGLAYVYKIIIRMSVGRLIQELQNKLSADSSPQSLSAADATKLHNLLRSAKFPNPDGVHLSSAGEYNLRLGVIKELHPDLIATHQGVCCHYAIFMMISGFVCRQLDMMLAGREACVLECYCCG